MSLRVWLPLDGDLRNLGCSEVTATVLGATVNTSGKIGSCYSFDGSNDFISLSGNTLYNIFKGGSQQFSICFWVYHNDATRAIIFGDYGLSGAIGFNIELTTSHGVRFYWNGSPDKNFNSTSYVAAQGWTHIVITYSGSILNIYRNGILSTDSWSGTLATKNKTAGQFYLGRDSRTGTTVLNGRLNDFRIYDHCLSAAEVRKIAQGLVLHYKLDDITYGIEDSSGYNHNGEILNTLSLVSDTPRYNTCVHISATNQKIKISNFPTSGFGNSYSFSWWAKISSASPMHWGFSDGIRLNGMYTGRLWNTGDSSNNPLYKPGTTTQVGAPTVNVWHHWVMTGDGTTCKVYQDGIHWGTAKTYKAISGQTIYINGWDSGTGYSSNNYSISDFRIYCTALDANAIRQLYELGMKIDNNHNLHAFEVVENNNKISLNNKRQFKCDEVVESESAKFFKREELVEVHQIVEC